MSVTQKKSSGFSIDGVEILGRALRRQIALRHDEDPVDAVMSQLQAGELVDITVADPPLEE
jgi:hypothetical protein